MDPPIYTIDPLDLPEVPFPKKTSENNCIYYEVIYYDTHLKYKSRFICPVKKGDDVITILRCYISLEEIRWKHKLEYPFVHEQEKVLVYIEKVKKILDLPEGIVDLFSIAERIFHPNDFYERFEFDFRETALRKSPRKTITS